MYKWKAQCQWRSKNMGGTLKKKIGTPAPPKIRKITCVRAKRALKFRFLGKRVQKYLVINDFLSIFSDY